MFPFENLPNWGALGCMWMSLYTPVEASKTIKTMVFAYFILLFSFQSLEENKKQGRLLRLLDPQKPPFF